MTLELEARDATFVEGRRIAASPAERPMVVLDHTTDSFDEDLGWIVQQYRERVEAVAVAVTIHPRDGGAPDVKIFAGDAAVDEPAFRRRALLADYAACTGADARIATITWQGAQRGFPWKMMTLSLASDESSRAVISAIYAADSNIEPGPREFVATRFHPVLTGYFKLWLLHRSTSRRLETIIAALSYTDTGIIIVDGGADIVFENPTAKQILDEGTSLRRRGRSFSTGNMLESVRLRMAIEHVLAGEAAEDVDADGLPVVSVGRTNSDLPLIVAITPVARNGSGRHDPAAILHLFTPNASLDQVAAPICRWFGLSAAEIQLVTLLVTGSSVPDLAEHAAIKEATVRTYLKNIYRKTNTRNQADLVRLIMANLVRVQRETRLPIDDAQPVAG